MYTLKYLSGEWQMIEPVRSEKCEFWSDKKFETFDAALDYARALKTDWKIINDKYLTLAWSRYNHAESFQIKKRQWYEWLKKDAQWRYERDLRKAGL